MNEKKLPNGENKVSLSHRKTIRVIFNITIIEFDLSK